MTKYKRFALTAVAVVLTAGGVSGASLAGEPQRPVTGESGIQSRLEAEDLQEFANEKFELVAPDRGDPYFGPEPDASAVVVPEPGTMALLGVGLAALVAARRKAARKRHQRA